ncbi:MAG: hypothetical protein ACREPJ_12055, partial [Rhodanobacteraceae bacterium]
MTDTMQAEAGTEANEAQIAVHWQEEKYIQPPKEFVEQAILRDPDVRKRFGEEHFPDCFREYADMLTWYEPYKQVLDTS